MKCNAPVERDFDIEAEPLPEGLCRGVESEAFPWGEVVHEEDVLEVVAGGGYLAAGGIGGNPRRRRMELGGHHGLHMAETERLHMGGG